MPHLFHRFVSYWQYRAKAGNAHDIHSPFVFELFTQLIDLQKDYYVFDEIEDLRTELIMSDEKIEVTDFGAGHNRTRTRGVSAITKTSAKSAATGQLLFKLVNKFQPKVMLELGTSLGISTLYQATARRKAAFYTLEGCPNTAQWAAKHFKRFGLEHIAQIVGNIDETLPSVLTKIERLDYALFDANHRYEPTMRYFELCLAKAHEDSLFVFDDIHWSADMQRAWQQIYADSRVTVSIDLYDVGLVFFRKKQPKQHFVLRFGS